VILDRDVGPARVGLFAEAKEAASRMEVERLTIWSAKNLPVPGGADKVGKP
jgi:hypothetical protein